jgi:aryl-alcohol dehydrogenase-like predicted oxidoreductase
VTILSFGAMELRGQPYGLAIQDAGAGRLLGEVHDGGINLIDTSVVGAGVELIGRHLSHRRDEFFLASKCGCPVTVPDGMPSPPYPHDFSRETVRAGVEQSLRRLRTDWLVLVQVQLSPSRDDLEAHGTITTLQSLRDEGKLRFIGMSGTLPNLPDHLAIGVFDVFQIPTRRSSARTRT